MTATTTAPSIYPPTVADLLPQARVLAAESGEVPSRNELMRTFAIGAPKATALRDALLNPTAAEPDKETVGQPDAALDPAEPTDEPEPATTPIIADRTQLPAVVGHPEPMITPAAAITAAVPARPVQVWPVYLIALPAAVAIWSGWVGLGGLTGFGVVHPLPGIADSFSLNTAITLPIGVEAYAAYALRAWLAGSRTPRKARRFAKWSAIGSLLVGAAGQVAYHLMESAGMTTAPWQITTAVSCLPVAVLGMGAALAHLLNNHDDTA